MQKSFLILNFSKVNLRFNSIRLVPIRIFTAEPHLPAGRQGDRRVSIIFPLPLRDRQRKTLQAFMRLSAEGLGGYGETASHACVPKRCTSACRHDSFTRENLLSATSAALRWTWFQKRPMYLWQCNEINFCPNNSYLIWTALQFYAVYGLLSSTHEVRWTRWPTFVHIDDNSCHYGENRVWIFLLHKIIYLYISTGY